LYPLQPLLQNNTNKKAQALTTVPELFTFYLYLLRTHICPQHAKEVPAEYLLNIFFAIPSGKQLAGNYRHIGYTVELLWSGCNAVEVGAEADVVNAYQLHDVVEMVHQQGEWRTQLGGFFGVVCYGPVSDLDRVGTCFAQRVNFRSVIGPESAHALVIVRIQEAGEEVEVNHAAIFGDGLYLVIFQVAGVRVEMVNAA